MGRRARLSAEPRPTEVKGSRGCRLMKHKINKLELQIGLKCGERAPPGSSSSQGSADCYQVRAVCDSRAEQWCGRGRPWNSSSVQHGCC